MFSTIFVVLVMSSQFNGVSCDQKNRTWIRWNVANVTFGTPVAVQGSFTAMECLTKCELSDSCVSVHVNKDSSGCEFSKYYPLQGNLVPEPRQGWRVYYRGLKEVRAINVWPDSQVLVTIDWLTETWSYSLSFLALEFQYSGNVGVIYTHFLEGYWWYQNKDFTLLVYNTFANAKNDNNGMVCVDYTGPAIGGPRNFTCQPPLYGKALRLNYYCQGYAAALRLREIHVLLI